MPIQIELKLTPAQAADERYYTDAAAKAAGAATTDISYCRIVRRSIDARKRGAIIVNMALEVGVDKEAPESVQRIEYGDVSNGTEVIIVGAGPAGLFAALELIERGYRPILLERGVDVSRRKHSIAAINRNEAIDPDSNYCFGEGGAGTYSDGKLYTRSKKRGTNRKILEILHLHGAGEEILYEAHPHIGTDKLPRIIEQIRKTITQAGGVVHFETRVSDFIIRDNKIHGVVDQHGNSIEGAAVILSTGHSARDIYELLHKRGVMLEAKPFAMGVRVEHQQSLIDMIQYKQERGEHLPAASYSLVAQVEGRGVYSFCMCPGGFIVPAGTAPGECVVNGMSPSGRNNIYANSGIVTQVGVEDFADLVPHFGVLAGLKFQQQLEMMGSAQGGSKGQTAPAQLLTDFVLGQKSLSTLPTSYHPGVVVSDMDKWMPRFMSKALRGGFRQFDNKMNGFVTDQAQIIGIESRTSSPVRIPRDRESYMHPAVAALFPSGEGAGYAGGIVSAAVDGSLTAQAVSRYLD